MWTLLQCSVGLGFFFTTLGNWLRGNQLILARDLLLGDFSVNWRKDLAVVFDEHYCMQELTWEARGKLGQESRKYMEEASGEKKKDSCERNWDWEKKGSKRGQTRRWTGGAWASREWILCLVNKGNRTEGDESTEQDQIPSSGETMLCHRAWLRSHKHQCSHLQKISEKIICVLTFLASWHFCSPSTNDASYPVSSTSCCVWWTRATD